MPFTKLQAAQHQVDCAIRLFFSNEDLLSAITLAHASFRVLQDIYPVLNSDGFERNLNKLIGDIGWKKFTATANFLKHADNDPHDILDPHPIDALMAIGFAVILHNRLAGYSADMRGFNSFMAVTEPDVFAGTPDPDHHAYADFQKAVESMKGASHSERMAFGRLMLETSRAMGSQA